MKIEHMMFLSGSFFRITDPCTERSSLLCSRDLFFITNKIGSMKLDHVNGPSLGFYICLHLKPTFALFCRVILTGKKDVRFK